MPLNKQQMTLKEKLQRRGLSIVRKKIQCLLISDMYKATNIFYIDNCDVHSYAFG